MVRRRPDVQLVASSPENASPAPTRRSAADEREDAGGGGDRWQAEPRAVDDVLDGRFSLDLAPRELGGRDDRQRGRGRRDEHRGEEVRVRERRDSADADPRSPAKCDQEEGLQRERHSGCFGEQHEPFGNALEPQPPERPAERGKRHAERNRGVRGEPHASATRPCSSASTMNTRARQCRRRRAERGRTETIARREHRAASAASTWTNAAATSHGSAEAARSAASCGSCPSAAPRTAPRRATR